MKYRIDHLSSKCTDNIFNAFASIPPDATSLDLSKNGLGSIQSEVLAKAFSLMHANVIALDLSMNNLNNMTGIQLATAFKGIPDMVRSIDLSDANLVHITTLDLITALKSIPQCIKFLNLGTNNFQHRTAKEFAQLLQAIPESITTLNLSNNSLFSREGVDLKIIFAAIPKGVTSLILKNNYFGLRERKNLSVAFKMLPTNITSLDFTDNCIGLMTTIPELRESLIAIPPNIISINLYSNPLHKITTDGLEVLKDTLPHVTKLCLSADELQKMSLKQIRAFKNIFPNLRIEDLIFIDENDKTRRPNLKELKQLGFVPSLKLISAFFVLENQLSKNIKADELPIELVRYIDSLKQ